MSSLAKITESVLIQSKRSKQLSPDSVTTLGKYDDTELFSKYRLC